MNKMKSILKYIINSNLKKDHTLVSIKKARKKILNQLALLAKKQVKLILVNMVKKFKLNNKLEKKN